MHGVERDFLVWICLSLPLYIVRPDAANRLVIR